MTAAMEGEASWLAVAERFGIGVATTGYLVVTPDVKAAGFDLLPASVTDVPRNSAA